VRPAPVRRLDLAMRRIQHLECAATHQPGARPGGPEGDFGLAQGVQVQRMHALGRRDAAHVREVLFKQRVDVGAGKIVDSNVHAFHSLGGRA
jgi:hypothetical protein